MKFSWLCWTLWCAVGASGFADPVLLLSGEPVKTGKFSVDAWYETTDYLRRYDSGGSPMEFPAGESRRMVRLPFLGRYGLPGGEELVVKSAYWDASHRTATAYLSKTGFSDTLVMVRSLGNLFGDLSGALGLGIKIPTGQNLFIAGANEFPTGEGNWEGVASFAWADRRNVLIFHAEVTYFLGFPRSVNAVMGRALTEEVRFGFTHRFQWGIGAEFKATDALNLMGELLVRNRFNAAGAYASTGADASGEIAAFASPEYGTDRQDAISLAPIVQIQLMPGMKISGGALFPVRIANGFGGVTYFGHFGAKF